MNAVTPFIFEDQLVRTVSRENAPWFVGRDVCHVLDIKNESHALARLDDDERAEVAISDPSGSKKAIIVSEPGVFRLIFTSRKPEAERFKRWLAHEVLPSLRRSGRFETAADEPQPITGEAVPILTAKLALVREARHLFGHARARSLWSEIGLPIPDMQPDGGQEEARACLEEILAQKPAGSSWFIREALEAALNDDEQAQAMLAAHGLRIAREPAEGFLVANAHHWLESVFSGSKWDYGRWRRVLRRLRGAAVAAKQRYGSVEARGTYIPARFLDDPPLI
jgi:prophage antirepressor-like protein